MKVENAERLTKKLRKLPREVRADVVKAIARSTNEGVRVARVLAPNVTGETVEKIEAKFLAEGMIGIVQAVDNDGPRDEKDRAYSIEHGRKKGKRGTTTGSNHMWTARTFLAKKHRAAIKRAINKAVKRVAGNV